MIELVLALLYKPVAVLAAVALAALVASGEWIQAAVAGPGVLILIGLSIHHSRKIRGGRGAEGPR